jgi:hypothetical protein
VKHVTTKGKFWQRSIKKNNAHSPQRLRGGVARQTLSNHAHMQQTRRRKCNNPTAGTGSEPVEMSLQRASVGDKDLLNGEHLNDNVKELM